MTPLLYADVDVDGGREYLFRLAALLLLLPLTPSIGAESFAKSAERPSSEGGGPRPDLAGTDMVQRSSLSCHCVTVQEADDDPDL